MLMFEMMAGRSPFDIITDNPDMNTEDYLFQGIVIWIFVFLGGEIVKIPVPAGQFAFPLPLLFCSCL